MVATGSSPYCPEVIGKDKRHMLTAREVIQDNAETGENMLVVAPARLRGSSHRR